MSGNSVGRWRCLAAAAALGVVLSACAGNAAALPAVTGVKLPAQLGGRPIQVSPPGDAAAQNDLPVVVESPIEIATRNAYYGTSASGQGRIRLVVHVARRDFSNDEFEVNLADLAGWPGKGELSEIVVPDQAGRGGVAKCGVVTMTQSSEVLCGWHLRSFMVFVTWYEHKLSELVAELPSIRDEVEIRQ